MAKTDDSDIKIFEAAKSKDRQTDDLLEAAAFLHRQRANGNIEKARLLGAGLALLDPGDFEPINTSMQLKSDSEFMHQARALLVFVVQTTLHGQLGSDVLSSCAVNAMYDKLIENQADFYERICDGTAFTLYTLAMKEKDFEAKLGEAFAALCPSEADKDFFKQLGIKIFYGASAATMKIIEKYKFSPL
ncbi:MAG: hypothetical protein GX345_08630 [Clostridiales bacterium]|nr:hypothetical protein [Clostridiales bacterium]